MRETKWSAYQTSQSRSQLQLLASVCLLVSWKVFVFVFVGILVFQQSRWASNTFFGVFCANISIQIPGASPHLHHSSKTCRVLRLQRLPRRYPGESPPSLQYSHSVPTLWGLVGSRLRLGSSSLFCERHPRGSWDPHPGWTIHSAWPPEIRTYANTTRDKEYPQKISSQYWSGTKIRWTIAGTSITTANQHHHKEPHNNISLHRWNKKQLTPAQFDLS